MTLEFDVDFDYLTDGGIKDMPQWVRLNDENYEYPPIVYVNNASFDRVVKENMRLRRFAYAMAHCAAGHGCDICPINDGEGFVSDWDMCESAHNLMGELGVSE